MWPDIKKRKYQNYHKYSEEGEEDPWDGGVTPGRILRLVEEPKFQSADRTTKRDMLRRILREHDDDRDHHELDTRKNELRRVPWWERSRRRYEENACNYDRFTCYGTSRPLLPER